MRRQETALVKKCLVGAVAALLGCGSLAVQAQGLKKYESNTKDFWLNPPADWFLGDETEAQKGQVPNPGQPTPTPKADLDKILQKVKLPQGFKIEVWAAGVPQARQMALGDKGTLFVGTFDKGTVHTVTGTGDQKTVKPFITGFPDQFDTQLGKWFKNGRELSLGQWQKVALARSFMRRDAEILVLDEPTASMDAEAEVRIFERFRELTDDKIAIVISHRFSTVRMADQIIVLDHGKIIERGSHDSLLAKNGRYATLFNLQAQGYR